jgi:predicted O-linked N-acetylglucosamine transferase (SPINDLY family)
MMTSSPVETAFAEALVLHAAGRLDVAERRYRQILAAQPSHPAALHNLGALALQTGEPETARSLLEAACAVQPGRGEYWLTQAEAYLLCGQPDLALAAAAMPAAQSLAAYDPLRRRALDARASAQRRAMPPAAAIQALQTAYNAGRHGEAEVIARRLIAQYPAAGPCWKTLAAARLAQGKDAPAAAERAVALLPGDAEAHFVLGRERQRAGRLDEAEACLRQAQAMRGGFVEAMLNHGIVLKDLGRAADALACYRSLIALRPDWAEAHLNLGIAYYELARAEEAIAAFRRALAIQPDSPEILANLGHVLLERGGIREAETAYRRAIALRPGHAPLLCDLGNVLYLSGRSLEAIDAYRQALALKPDFLDAHGNLLMMANGMAGQAPFDLIEEARAYGRRLLAVRPPRPAGRTPDWPARADPERRLRIGLVSGDFRSHPVGFFLESALAALSRENLDVIAYSTNRIEDAATRRMKGHCTAWRSIAAFDDGAAEDIIRNDAIDVLMDLAGHTAGNRLPLFARRPAPVQASWLGYYATTGVAAMDYILGDRWVLPPDEAVQFIEKPWRLPDCYLCFTPPEAVLSPGPLPRAESGHITFGCFNNLWKMNDAVVALWARLLQTLPTARLFLKTVQLSDESMRRAVGERFAAHGIAPERLQLEGYSPRNDVLAAYRRVDIALDPFPYPGGTTTLEALWMGVPVLTLRGERFIGHVGESILHNAGLADWVAADAEDYLRRAARHAGDAAALAGLRARLRPQLLASPLCDAPRFARNLGEAWRGMWREWCAQQVRGTEMGR